jgi:hypothetical protein
MEAVKPRNDEGANAAQAQWNRKNAKRVTASRQVESIEYKYRTNCGAESRMYCDHSFIT